MSIYHKLKLSVTVILSPYFLFCILYAIFFTLYISYGFRGSRKVFAFDTLFIAFNIIMIFCVIRILQELNELYNSEGDYGEKYVEVDKTLNETELGLQLLSYTRRLRRVAFAYERQRRRLTFFGTIMATASVLIPLVTWIYILKDAFQTEKSLPNAWLLVVSSTTAGTLGLAIAITILKHVKNSQKPLSDVQERLLDSIEAGIVVNSSNLDHDIRRKAIQHLLIVLCAKTRKNIDDISDDEKDKFTSELASDSMKSLLSAATSSNK